LPEGSESNFPILKDKSNTRYNNIKGENKNLSGKLKINMLKERNINSKKSTF
jgi:hypothetical protein